MSKKKNDAAERVAAIMADTVAPIAEAIAAGIADPEGWSAPWHRADPAAFLPTNPSTGATYTGGNRIALAVRVMFAGASPWWATFRQWQNMSTDDAPVSVRRGEKASYVIRPATAKRTDTDTGEETTRIIGWRGHAVFHAGQVDGWTPPEPVDVEPAAPVDERADIAGAYTFAAGIGARVEESPTAGASYSPQLDRVMMPDRDRFTSGHGAWSTMAHELTHWTGHPDRLARTFGKRFGDDAYAAEELTAELGAAFTLAAIGRSTEPRPDHAHYLAHWLRILNSAPDALWHVAGRAERAAAYLVERSAVLPEPVTA